MSALSGIRIVETAESVAGEYCGKLLADFGAEVIKLERPGVGSPTRASSTPGLFGYLNTNKRSVVPSLAERERLLASAHAVVDDRTSAADVAAAHPDVVVCSITPFGHDAAAEWRNAKSINVFHASGWGYHTPSHAAPDQPPLQGPGRYLADYEAGLEAALCLSSALFARLHRGVGEFIEVSQHAVLASRADCVTGRFVSGEIAPEGTRGDYDQAGPASFFACADGYVYLYVTSRAHWAGLRRLLDDAAWLDEFEDDWLEFSVTAAKVARFHRGFGDWIAGLDRESAATRAQHLGVPLVPVYGAGDLAGLPQYRHRGFFQQLGAVRYPGVPYLMSASPARIISAAPELGADTVNVLAGLGAPPIPPAVLSPQLKTPVRARGGPLAGVRVVELTKVWAGPYAGKLLAFLGAEVIKVESAAIPEEMRAYGGTDIDHAPFFLSINPEILSVDIDIKSTAGMDRLRGLIADSDVVLNNLRPGAMERQGLGYEHLTALKRDIISVSIKMWGNDGPLGYQTGYAPCFAALGGMAAQVGYRGGPPLGASMRYGDSTVGAAAAYAAVVAVLHRELTGEGQFVDVSAVEVLSSMIGDRLFEQGLSGRPLEPDGNAHPDYSPHGCYPCADGWIAIAVADDEKWRGLCDVIGGTGLNRAAPTLDADLGALTAAHSAGELAARLRAVGVAATRSATALDVIADEMLWERGAYRFVSDHVEGQRPVLGPSWRFARDPATIERGAPRLGEHDGDVFGQAVSR